VFARDQHGNVVGGLFAETQFSWLKISVMSVFVPFRSQGIGSELLRVAEGEAAHRGCRYAYVDTMEYQAPQFYRRQGYQAAGELKDWDSHGHTKYLFTKLLTGGDFAKQN
jgi:GNAT superfamily N-acetyltransferase